MPDLRRCAQRLCLPLLLALLPVALAASPGPPARAPVDALEASLAGEFALQAGHLPDAARQYLAAAGAAGDPVLAERAARVALLADQDALAREALELWRRLAPGRVEARQMVATSLAIRAGDRRQASRELRSLLQADGGWRGAIAAMTGAVGKQPALVVRLLKQAIDSDWLPTELPAWLGAGGLAQRLDQPQLVERIVREVTRRFPGEPRVALLHAQLLREGGKLDEARAVLESLAGQAGLAPPLRWSLAAEFDALGNPARAAQVLAAGERDPASDAQRAALLDKAGDQAGLAALYEELKQRGTDPNPLRRLLLGQLAESLKRPEDALTWYASVPGDQGQAMARLRSAVVRHGMGERAAAFGGIRALQGDAALDDEARRDAYLLEAELQRKDGNAGGEQDALARGLAAFPDNLELLYARALMWERQDHIDKAEADLRRILVIEPENVAALNALGYTLADRTRRYREALELIDRARVAQPGNAAIIDSYGWVLFRLGKPREALSHLRHAWALQKDPDIASHLGQVLWVLGQKDEARRLFDEARRLEPENRSLVRALQETGA